MESNSNIQRDEIEALAAIYEDGFILGLCFKTDYFLNVTFQNSLTTVLNKRWSESETSFSIMINEGGGNVEFHVSFPPGYPTLAPPTYTESAPHLSRMAKAELATGLDNLYLENIGEPVVFLWVEFIRNFLQERTGGSLDEKKEEGEQQSSGVQDDTEEVQAGKCMKCPEIRTGEPVEDRRSVFQAHAARVSSVQEVELVLATLLGNKKIAQATHNIRAYRIRQVGGGWLSDCEDDGEDAAGGRLLHLLDILGATDTLVVVTRWYGGVHLGPDRFKHINNAARRVLEDADLVVVDRQRKKKAK